jgi:hypothetical protein
MHPITVDRGSRGIDPLIINTISFTLQSLYVRYPFSKRTDDNQSRRGGFA